MEVSNIREIKTHIHSLIIPDKLGFTIIFNESISCLLVFVFLAESKSWELTYYYLCMYILFFKKRFEQALRFASYPIRHTTYDRIIKKHTLTMVMILCYDLFRDLGHALLFICVFPILSSSVLCM